MLAVIDLQQALSMSGRQARPEWVSHSCTHWFGAWGSPWLQSHEDCTRHALDHAV